MDPVKGAQDVIRCDVCSDNEREKSPAEVHCNTCHIYICSPCVASHMTWNKSKKHDIVLFDVDDTEIILPSCSSHPQLKCDLFCKRCSIPICLKCLLSDHNSHSVADLTEWCQKRCEDIENETEELQQCIIPVFQKISAEEDEHLKKFYEACDKVESSIEEHGKDLHRKIDAEMTDLKTYFQQKKKEDAKIQQQQWEEINEIFSKAKQAVVRNEALLKSKNISCLIAHKSENTKLSKIPVRKTLTPHFFPEPISAELLKTIFGELPSNNIVQRSESTISLKRKPNSRC